MKIDKLLEVLAVKKPIKGMIFGHYDSRGGTVFVVGDQKTAMKKYCKDFCGGMKSMASEDLLGPATLYIDQYSSMSDLEDNGKVYASRGRKGDFMEAKDFPCDLEYVKKGQKPSILKNPVLPLWNDDAFGFIVL
jgi:hypothetical protein